jgi:plasmid stability protein
MRAAIHESGPDDRMAEVIKAAIGSNDPYPTAVQLAAHRAKQSLREQHFENQDTTEVAK